MQTFKTKYFSLNYITYSLIQKKKKLYDILNSKHENFR